MKKTCCQFTALVSVLFALYLAFSDGIKTLYYIIYSYFGMGMIVYSIVDVLILSFFGAMGVFVFLFKNKKLFLILLSIVSGIMYLYNLIITIDDFKYYYYEIFEWVSIERLFFCPIIFALALVSLILKDKKTDQEIEQKIEKKKTANNSNVEDVADTIKKYKEMYDQGLINEEEFASIKSKIMGI